MTLVKEYSETDEKKIVPECAPLPRLPKELESGATSLRQGNQSMDISDDEVVMGEEEDWAQGKPGGIKLITVHSRGSNHQTQENSVARGSFRGTTETQQAPHFSREASQSLHLGLFSESLSRGFTQTEPETSVPQSSISSSNLKEPLLAESSQEGPRPLQPKDGQMQIMSSNIKEQTSANIPKVSLPSFQKIVDSVSSSEEFLPTQTSKSTETYQMSAKLEPPKEAAEAFCQSPKRVQIESPVNDNN